MTTDPAVTAAASALANHLTASGDNLALAGILPTARAAIAAARPIIEAEVRERIAAEIEARLTRERERHARNGYINSFLDGLRTAARITRGQT